MLNIFYGDMKEAVYNTASYFKYDYEEGWIVDPMVKEMIQDSEDMGIKKYIDDAIEATDKIWSSSKIRAELNKSLDGSYGLKQSDISNP